MSEERELPLDLPSAECLSAAETSLRGKFDVSRLERDHKQLVDLIAWLISLPGMTHKAIADHAGVAWETVAAIAATRAASIRQFKLRQAGKLALVLDAATPGLLAKAAAGKLSALDYKLLVDAYLQLSGDGHTVRFEGRQEDDPRRARLRDLISGGSREMVLEAEVIPQTAALPLPSIVHKNTIDSRPD